MTKVWEDSYEYAERVEAELQEQLKLEKTLPGYIDPKLREQDDDPLGDIREGPKTTWLQAIGMVLGAILACALAGAFALWYLFTQMLPSLNH